MSGFTLAISCCVKTSNIPCKFVKYIDFALFKAVTMPENINETKNSGTNFDLATDYLIGKYLTFSINFKTCIS